VAACCPSPSCHLFANQERRKELSKKVAKMGEDGKVAVRNIRKDILKKLDK
jgi:ribosome recycling factor